MYRTPMKDPTETFTQRLAAIVGFVFLLIMLFGCTGNPDPAVSISGDTLEADVSDDYVTVCVDSKVYDRITVNVYNRSGGYLTKIIVPGFGAARDSISWVEARGRVHFGVEAVAVRGERFPHGIQDVHVHDPMGVVIGMQGNKLFAHSGVDSEPCTE